MNKKAITILSIIFIIAALGVLFFFFRKAPEMVDDTNSGTFPTGGETDNGVFNGSKDDDDEDVSSGNVGSLTQLTKNAVSGAAVSTSTVRYIERATGHIYGIDFDGRNRLRVSNTTLLKSFESSWSPAADKLAIRYFEDPVSGLGTRLSVKTFLASIVDLVGDTGSLENGATTTELKGVFLPQSAAAVAVSPGEDRVFYLNSSDGTTNGITADFENKKQKNIFESSFGEFNVAWPSKDIIALLTKPSAEVDGYLYFLNPSTKSFKKIMGGIKGLTATVSPKGDKVIYSQSANKIFKTKIFDVKQKTSEDFSFAALPEKCVWSGKDGNVIYCAAPEARPAADYPDEWYQGVFSFNDAVWSKNFLTGETGLLAKQFNADMVNLILSKDEDYLIFTDKNDGTLWSLKLK